MMNYFSMACSLSVRPNIYMSLFDCMVMINSCKGNTVFADDKIAFVLRVSFRHSLNVCSGIATGNAFCGIGDGSFRKGERACSFEDFCVPTNFSPVLAEMLNVF